MVNFIIITHGEFGAYMVEAAEEIVGRQEKGIRVISVSSRFRVDEIKRRIERDVRDLNQEDGLIVVTDIPGGTPANLVLPVTKDLSNAVVISGLNLYMLISGFNRRKTEKLMEVARRMLSDGQKSIQDIKALLLQSAA